MGADMDDMSELKNKLAQMETQFDATMNRTIDCLSKAQNTASNQSTISINAGGVGVWVATTACAVMLAVNVMLVGIIVSHERKLDDLSDYIHAIYMMAPSLKPAEKQQ